MSALNLLCFYNHEIVVPHCPYLALLFFGWGAVKWYGSGAQLYQLYTCWAVPEAQMSLESQKSCFAKVRRRKRVVHGWPTMHFHTQEEKQCDGEKYCSFTIEMK